MVAGVRRAVSPADRAAFHDELTGQLSEVADRDTEAVAFHHGAQARREDARGDQLRPGAAFEPECRVDLLALVRDRARFHIELGEELARRRRGAQRHEEDGREVLPGPARTAQVANAFAAERSTEVAQEDDMRRVRTELLPQRR